MSPQDIADREIYRFTGPPENWLTAIKFMTWGLEEKHLNYWQKIEPGDIFLMHSTSTNTLVKDAPSSVIGFGVVSPEFSKKDSTLWLREIEERRNIWPLLVPFSEVYLFSELRPHLALEAPNGKNNELIISEAKELLAKSVPLSQEFPKMGSFSRVKSELVVQIFARAEHFYLYSSVGVTRESPLKSSEFKKVESAEEVAAIRKPATLEQLQIVKKKTIKLGKTTYTKDLQTLEKAEDAHQETLKMLFELLKSHGYNTYNNRHVDLFAVKNNHSFLFEVKSLAAKNFRPQARKGIVQLFEYEYFEVRNFFEDKGPIARPNKALIFSEGPKDMNYVSFINDLNISAGFFSERKLKPSGQKTILTGLIS
ncbi:MAG: hypothetical protein WDZ34_02455 [Candidatus Saccharimonadales bacterium]